MKSYFIRIIFARTYRYLLLTFLSILVGAFLFGGTFALTQSISNYFIEEGKVLTGGDFIISGARPIDTDAEPFTLLRESGYTIIQQYGVQAVFSNAGKDKSTPASIRAVDAEFPLYGAMVTEPVFTLEKNTLFAEQAFYDRLGIKKGDTVILGETPFVTAGVILSEPDSLSLGLSFTPKVIVRRADLVAADIDISQSRTNYRVALRSDRGTPTEEDVALLEGFAETNKLRFDNALDGPNRFVRGLSSVESFVSIIISIALFLVSVNIIANLTYILAKMQKMIAILKIFGARNTDVRTIFMIIFGVIGFGAGATGALMGSIATQELLHYFGTFVTGDIRQMSLWGVMLVGGAVGLAIVLSSAIPFLSSLKSVSPKQLLANTTMADISYFKKSLPYIAIPIVLAVALYILSGNIWLVLYSVLTLIALFALFMFVAHSVIRLLSRYRSRFGFIVESSIASLKWRGVEAVIIIAAIMTAFSGVFIISVLEKNIEANISQNVSQKAPSLYIIDITQSQLAGVKEITGPLQAYPIVRGRLLKVDGRDLTKSDDPGITREFNMTYRDALINGEEIIRGEWHGEKSLQKSVSIDDNFAKEIGGVKIGDKIEVFIQGITIEATISSIRSTDQSSGLPFFYLVFSSDVLASFPASYFGTIDVPVADIPVIEQKLGQAYPNIIPIQTAKILDTVTSLVSNLVQVVQFIGIPSIILGLMLVMVMTAQSLFERQKDVLVLRAFGFSRRATTILFITEISAIVGIASIVAYTIAHILTAVLNATLFDFDVFVFDSTPLWIVAFSLLSVSLFAYFISLSLSRTPLRKLLSEK